MATLSILMRTLVEGNFFIGSLIFLYCYLSKGNLIKNFTLMVIITIKFNNKISHLTLFTLM